MTDYAADHIPDWSRKPDAAKLTKLIEFVGGAKRAMEDEDDFRVWLTKLAYRNDPTAACSNGHDHGCNRGLGEWLGIEPYGQGKDGSVPWNEQIGYSSERLNRFVNPMWRAAIIKAPLVTQIQMYIDLLSTLRDKGEYVYDWSSYNFGQDRPTVLDPITAVA